MADIAGWIALIATCVAALMTAANLGARITGWGFVIFTIGAIAWITMGIATGQQQLLYSNIFLGVVDIVGVWRWLGQRAKIADAAHAEERSSSHRPGENLFSVAKLDGLPVKASDGEIVAHAVDALVACKGGTIDYLVIRVGGVAGVGEALCRLPWREVEVAEGEVRTLLDKIEIERLPQLAA